MSTLFFYRDGSHYLLHEFVIMPDRVHLILTPKSSIERAVQFVKGGFSRHVGEKAPGLEIWQKGFADHSIRDSNDFNIHRSYLRGNPVRAGLSASPEEFAYSSASKQFELDLPPQRLKPLA